MIQSLPIREETKARMQQSLALMVSARDRARCTQMRFELQGMINALETEGVISIGDMDAIGAAFGRLWRTICQDFIVAAKQSTGRLENNIHEQKVS